MEYKRIENDFITRSIEILESYDGNYEVTLLINLCIGLIVVPKEHHMAKIEGSLLDDSSWGIKKEDVKFSPSIKEDYKLNYIIRRLRNGITHFNIKSESSNGEIGSFTIRDQNPRDINDYLLFTLTPETLKYFALKLARHVQKL